MRSPHMPCSVSIDFERKIMSDNEKIVGLLKNSVHGINHLVEVSGERHIIDVPSDSIEKHDLFGKIRGKDPSDLGILSASIKETDGAVYMPCLYIELIDDSSLAIYVVDGHQRVDAEKANGSKTITAQWISRWDTPEKAFRGAVGVQFAHFHPVEPDVISILRTGKLTHAEIASKTGLTQSKVSRLAKVADQSLDWLYTAVQDKILGLGVAGKLVEACDNNRGKLAAFQNTFCDKRDKAEQQRLYWENHMKSRKRKWDRKTKAKAYIATYFKDVDWNTWIDALKSNDGKAPYLELDGDTKPKKLGVRIGDKSDWQKEFALYGLFEKAIDSVDPQDIDDVLKHWDQIGDILRAIRDQEDIPSINPTEEPSPPPPPNPQQPDMAVDDDSGDDDVDDDDE